MTHHGRYETVDELHRGPLASVALAHLVGDDEADEFVVKSFDPSSMGLLEADGATQSFLDRAGLQKMLADRGAQHWAPIYEMKATAEGAYYVTDFYPLSAQKLLDAQVRLGPADLYWLISGLVQGLLELKNSRKRAHANLKPTNVLLASRQQIRGAGVFLTDPALDGRGHDDSVSDARAVGRLIYQFVAQRPYAGDGDWPFPDGASWSALGRQGRDWFDLCRKLLDPAARPEDLSAVAVAVDGLAPKPPARRRRLLALAALPAVVLAAGLLYLAHANHIASDELSQVDTAWFAKFAHAMEDPARRERFRADPGLAPIVGELESAETRHLPLDSMPPAGFRLTGSRQSREILAAIGRIDADLTPDHWLALANLSAEQARFAQWGWTQPADFLATIVRDVHPAPGADVAGAIDRALAAQAHLADADANLRLWSGMDADLRQAGASDDHKLSSLASALRASASAAVRMNDGTLSGFDQIKDSAPTAAALAQLAKAGWPAGFGRDRFEREVESKLNLAEPSPADIRQWADAAPGYALVRLDPSSPTLASLRESFTQARDDITRQALDPDTRRAAEHAADEVASRIELLARQRYLRRDLLADSGDLASARQAVQKDIDALRKQWVRLDNPAEWLAFIDQPLSATSDRLKQRWKVWVQAERERIGQLAVNHEQFLAAKSDADAVRQALVSLDEKFPPAPVGLNEAFAAAAYDRREQDLAALSAWSAPVATPTTAASAPAGAGPATSPSAATTRPAFAVSLPPADLGIAAAAAKYAAWTADLTALARDFPLRHELMPLDDRPDQKWKIKAPEFWNDPVVQTLVRVDVSRLANLQAVADATRDQLVHLASTSETPEIALAAWSRLGRTTGGSISPVSPPWPTRKGELESELLMRQRLAPMVKSVRNVPDATAAADELKRQGPIRWRRYTDMCDPELLPASARLFRSFDVDEAAVKLLTRPAHFDFFLCLAHAAVASARDDQATAAIDNLKVSASALKDRPEVADLLERLESLATPQPMNDPRLIGQKPGDSYKLTIKDSPYSLTFIRVAPTGERPFYLATTDTSIGVFMDAVNAAGSWSAANALLGPPTAARGPQAWARAADPAQPIVRFPTWRYDDGRNAAQEFVFAPELLQSRFNRHALALDLGGNPQEEHPMQQTPAQAAFYAAGLLNCRLPSSREWKAAYDLYEAKTDVRQWNLRDQTFKMQLDFHAPGAPNQWPDNGVAGVYWPRNQAKPGQPNCRDTSDGTLLFRKVDAPGGTTFLSLVGNVAEFVCDAPDAFDSLADKKSPDVVTRFAAAMVAAAKTPKAPTERCRLFVIGGSALSAPELELTRPYPVASAAEPFADVGFRLAFTAPAAGLAERLKWAIEDQPYLPRPAAPIAARDSR